jgi:hypothetical protein
MSLEIGSITSVQEVEIELRHPVTDAPLGAFVTLASLEHPQRRQATVDVSRRLRAECVPGDADMLDEATNEIVARSVLGWRGIRENGTDLPYTPAAALDLLQRPEMEWLVKQLLREMGREENFIKTSAPG